MYPSVHQNTRNRFYNNLLLHSDGQSICFLESISTFNDTVYFTPLDVIGTSSPTPILLGSQLQPSTPIEELSSGSADITTNTNRHTNPRTPKMTSPYATPPMRDSWFAPVSIDMLAKVLKTSFFHPFIAWIIPLCFRAQNMAWGAPPMLVSFAWAALISFTWILLAVNNRLAFGLPREVDLSEEVIVITGGASGLGLLIAEVYGMRGATVAVLDIQDMENGEARGVTYYKCDVSDAQQVARVAAEIERDVSPPPFPPSPHPKLTPPSSAPPPS